MTVSALHPHFQTDRPASDLAREEEAHLFTSFRRRTDTLLSRCLAPTIPRPPDPVRYAVLVCTVVRSALDRSADRGIMHIKGHRDSGRPWFGLQETNLLRDRHRATGDGLSSSSSLPDGSTSVRSGTRRRSASFHLLSEADRHPAVAMPCAYYTTSAGSCQICGHLVSAAGSCQIQSRSRREKKVDGPPTLWYTSTARRAGTRRAGPGGDRVLRGR